MFYLSRKTDVQGARAVYFDHKPEKICKHINCTIERSHETGKIDRLVEIYFIYQGKRTGRDIVPWSRSGKMCKQIYCNIEHSH